MAVEKKADTGTKVEKKYVPDRGRLLERVAYRPGDLPAVTGLGLRTIHRAIATGQLRSFRRGRCRLVRRDALDEFLSDESGVRA